MSSRSLPLFLLLTFMMAPFTQGCDSVKKKQARRLAAKAVKDIRNESYVGATGKLKKAIEIYPHDEYTHFLLARTYELRNDLPAAIQEYNRAIYLGPNATRKAQSYYSLGNIYFKNKEFVKAALNFEKQLKVSGSAKQIQKIRPLGMYHLGMCYHRLKKYSESEDKLLKSISLKPDFIEAHNATIVMYYDQAKEQPDPAQSAPYFNKSISAAKKAIATGKANDRTYNLLGLAHQHLKQFPQAIEALNTAKNKNRYSAIAAYNLGATYDLWLEELLTKAKEEKNRTERKKIMDEASQIRDKAITSFKAFLQLKGGDGGLKSEVRVKIKKLNLMKDKELYEKLKKRGRRRGRRRRRRR
ncbi:MAG: hypothetical protein CL920_38090 [Deltaproteobacteria bacterium]|nr:hypothetical protein [Deltaproteobacteria bacterium]MBU54544.1 hypothetical protein [Deltaproteobacteria bacterium]